MIEWNLSDWIIEASPDKMIKPFEVVGKEYIKEFIKRFKSVIMDCTALGSLRSFIFEQIDKLAGDKLT